MMNSQQYANLAQAALVLACEIDIDSIKSKLIKLFPEFNSGRKTLDDFIEEILLGESCLDAQEDGQIIRVVNTVSVDIPSPLNDGKFLWELYQVYKSGEVVNRNYRGVREKIKGTEIPKIAAHRAIKEELGISVNRSTIKFIQAEFLDNPKSAYKGIISKTHLHSFTAAITRKDYQQEYREVQPQKTTIFGWRAAAGDSN